MPSSLTTRLKRAGTAVLDIFRPEIMQQAHGLLGGVWGYGGLPPARTADQYLQAYSTMPWLRAVSGKVSHTIAMTPWIAGYKQEKTPDKSAPNGYRYRAATDRVLKVGTADMRLTRRKEMRDDFKETPNHPILALLDAGNPFLTGPQVRQVTQIHLDILGEAFWLFERDKTNTPISIWPIPPSWVKQTPDARVAAYHLEFNGWRGVVPASEILWFPVADPRNPYGRGVGVGQALGDELETDEYAAKTIKSWFYNRARPDMMVSPKLAAGEEPFSTAELERLKEKWVADHEGFNKASRPYFSSVPLEVNVLSQSFESMQLTELRAYERNTILQVFGGIPPELMGIIENSNRATIDAADYIYSRHVIAPRLEFLRSILQTRLVPVYDERLVLDYENPVVEDREYQLKVMATRPESIKIDEWRERAGLPPLDDDAGQMFMLSPAIVVVPDLKDYAGETAIGSDEVIEPDEPAKPPAAVDPPNVEPPDVEPPDEDQR